MARLETDVIVVEATGFGESGEVPGFCARVYRESPERFEWAYGATETAAREALAESPMVLDLVVELDTEVAV